MAQAAENNSLNLNDIIRKVHRVFNSNFTAISHKKSRKYRKYAKKRYYENSVTSSIPGEDRIATQKLEEELKVLNFLIKLKGKEYLSLSKYQIHKLKRKNHQFSKQICPKCAMFCYSEDSKHIIKKYLNNKTIVKYYCKHCYIRKQALVLLYKVTG